MQTLIELFPLIYSIWTGILIVANVFIIIALFKIMRLEKRYGELNNRNDELHLIICAIVCTLNVTFMFINQDIVTYIIEAVITTHIFETMYFIYVVKTHLRMCPRLFSQK